MSSAIAASRGMPSLTKLTSLYLRVPSAKAAPLRSFSSIARNPGSLCPGKPGNLISHKPWTTSNPPRYFSASAVSLHGHVDPPKAGEELYVTFIDKEGDEHKIAVNKGDNLLTIAQAHDIEMEGACEGSCACSTCHVVVEDEEMFDKIPEATDDENDMLDLAFGLTETSRLGCQIVMTPELDGLRVKLPSATRNMQASNFGKK
ncbi:hypothetical protein G7Y89_g9318 [Cudoniella acicularis]|uniref:2Fe-2S ferredoxin-type domain-containing protein n=1 Tax=Cudoniella acicularis TaxID=354080 RepID=A0A8H4RH41_9HELO|nr:hypothetical protein G7Y89_g9318 [Cudoniella acicularis]